MKDNLEEIVYRSSFFYDKNFNEKTFLNKSLSFLIVAFFIKYIIEINIKATILFIVVKK